MIRFLFAPFRWAVGAIGLAAAAEAVWAHPVLCRNIRVFPHRVRPIQVEPGHIQSTDPNLDTA